MVALKMLTINYKVCCLYWKPLTKVIKTTYLIQRRDELIPVNVSDIAYFYIEASVVKVVTFNKQEYVVNKKLEKHRIGIKS